MAVPAPRAGPPPCPRGLREGRFRQAKSRQWLVVGGLRGGSRGVGESSEKVRARVEAARDKQRLRFLNTDPSSNAAMGTADVRAHCTLDEAGTSLMRTAMSQLQLSARAFHRVLKLVRTIADLADSPSIQPAHLPEALHLRPAATATIAPMAQ